MSRCINCIPHFKTRLIKKSNLKKDEFSYSVKVRGAIKRHKQVQIYYCRLGRLTHDVYVPISDSAMVNTVEKLQGCEWYCKV